MGHVPAAAAEGARGATGAEAIGATEHPTPVLMIFDSTKTTRAFPCVIDGFRPYTPAGLRWPRLLCRRSSSGQKRQ